MKKIIKSTITIGKIKITIIPNFQGVWGLYQHTKNYGGKYVITIEDMHGWNGLTDSEINNALKKCFGCDITIDKIRRMSYITYSSEHQSYFAAILKVRTLRELE